MAFPLKAATAMVAQSNEVAALVQDTGAGNKKYVQEVSCGAAVRPCLPPIAQAKLPFREQTSDVSCILFRGATMTVSTSQMGMAHCLVED